MAAALPFVSMGLQVFGALKGGGDESNALKYNASMLDTQGALASAEGYEQEARQRRAASGDLGRISAAAGEAGAGYGGSVGRSMVQSAVNAELDARTLRYRSQLQKWAYNAQASNLRYEAKSARTGGFLKAGSALLSGVSNYI